jgi:aspartate/glutamate racemase
VTESGPLVALVHATPLAIAPAAAAFRAEIPGVRIWNILDDRLLVDLAESGSMTAALRDRIAGLVGHAMSGGADAVALTCSAYSPVVDELEQRYNRPVLKPDAAMYRQVVADGHTRVGVLCSTPAAVEPALNLLAAASASADRPDAVTGEAQVCTEAAGAAEAGDQPALAVALAVAAKPLVDRGIQALLLAQYSLSAAAAPLQERFGLPCYSGPRAAAKELRAELGDAA